MINLAANLSMLFNEYDFLDRFKQAKKSGFNAVEYLFPYDYSKSEIKQNLDSNNLTQALFNAPPGNWNAGERGIACIPGREEEFIAGIHKALDYALELGNTQVHVMAGIKPVNVDTAAARECFINNIRKAADVFAHHGINVLIEPINNIDIPWYFVNFQEDAVELIEKIGKKNVRLQFDVYHCQIMQGNVISTFQKLQSYIDHVQVAGVPNRHELDNNELNYQHILTVIDDSGYEGFIGCEYHPKEKTIDGLASLFQMVNKL